MKTEIKQREDGEMELNITIPNIEFVKYWDKGFRVVQEKVEIDGFRKGNAPEDAIIIKYGEMAVLEEMANIAISDTYIKSVIENKLNVIGQPHIHVVKLSKADDFVYMAHVPVYPTITLPNYKKIAQDTLKDLKAKEEESTEVGDSSIVKSLNNTIPTKDEIDVVIGELAKGRGEGTVIDDAFAQSFGENFPTLESLRSKVTENLVLEKLHAEKEKNRAAIIEALLKTMTVKLPNILVKGEIDNMLAQIRHDVDRMGGKWEEYITHTGKTEDTIRDEYADIAEKRAMSQILLAEIAKADKIQPSTDEIDVEVIRIMANTPDAKEENVKSYVQHMLINEKVLQMLESQ